MPKKKLNINKLPKKERTLFIKCIKKFFYDKLPEIQAISEQLVSSGHSKMEIKDLGVEGAFEICLELFEDGILIMKSDNVENFAVITVNKRNLIILYEINKGERIT